MSVGACLNANEQHLGDAKHVIDLLMEISPTGSIDLESGPTKHVFSANWDELAAADFTGAISKLIDRAGRDRAADVLSQHNLFVFPNLFLPHEFGIEHLRRIEQFQGPAGFGTPDDIEAFHACQTGLNADAVEWIVLSRGMHREQVDASGVRHGHSTDETPQRALYREWQRLLSQGVVTPDRAEALL